jgi:multiple antibiotic resistance protein
LSAIVLVMGRTEGWANGAAIIGMLGICLALTFAAMLGADRLAEWLGKTGSDVIGRISGVLLAALAVQFVLDGLHAAH